MIVDSLLHWTRQSNAVASHSALLSHPLHWHEVSLVTVLTVCHPSTRTLHHVTLPALTRVLVDHCALLDCFVLVLTLNLDYLRWSEVSLTRVI